MLNKKTKIVLIVVFGIVILAALGGIIFSILGLVSQNFSREISFQDFIEKIRSGEIDRIYVDAYNWTGETLNAKGVVVERYTAVGPSIYNYTDFSVFVSDNGLNGMTCPIPSFADGLKEMEYAIALVVSAAVFIVAFLGELIFISTRKK